MEDPWARPTSIATRWSATSSCCVTSTATSRCTCPAILLVYYEQGNPRKFVVPDAFVVKGVLSRQRRIYKIWVEGKIAGRGH